VAKKQLTLITPEHNPLKGRVIVQIRSSQVTGLCSRGKYHRNFSVYQLKVKKTT
jgi:hypothetical protein